YTPFFSNVYWDSQDVFLPDLDRVEVISGPAGATWGSNAVNGVINILSKSAHRTQGTVVYGGLGTEHELSTGARVGGRFGLSGAYRVYAKVDRFDATLDARGRDDGHDGWTFAQTGFRTDWGSEHTAAFTVQGDAYRGRYDAGAAESRADGANLQGRWERALANDGSVWIRVFHDYTRRDVEELHVQRTHVSDFELQHQFHLPGDQLVSWGGNYRWIHDTTEKNVNFAILPARLTFELAGMFAQHQMPLFRDRARITTGLRLEHNAFSGWEHQPHVRFAWQASPDQTWWASVARSTRTPSRLESDFHAGLLPPHTEPPYVIVGNPDFRSEVLVAYELGWRAALSRELSLTATLYQHDYDQLRSVAKTFPITQANDGAGRSRGLELFLDWDVNSWWRLRTGGFVADQETWLRPGGTDYDEATGESSFPESQMLLRSTFWIGKRTVFWFGVRRVSAVPAYGEDGWIGVPAYTELDARVAFTLRPGLEVALTGRNLLDASHPEIGYGESRREIERNVRASIRWDF
ncbi:MAG TPA: TonB-dependent receptor, partial [Candidatus Synoicihabitans sp.]|nr:TonB-dependent receptor [Candidatus Synoicihabitans sp.]